MDSKDVMPDDYYELASNVSIECGEQLPRRGLLSPDDTVWLAPAGTVIFAEGEDMTKAAGIAKTLLIPEKPGEYKLYIEYADGSNSGEGTFTVYAGERKSAVNVSEGKTYNVSKLSPLEIKVKQGAKASVNGEEIPSGFKISEAGEWTITVVSQDGSEEKISFTTEVLEANRLLTDNITVKTGEDITFAAAPSDKEVVIWLAQSGLSAFDESDPAQSKATGEDVSIKAPTKTGKYILTVTDKDGNILSQSDAQVTVE